jgi:hypothetical protein
MQQPGSHQTSFRGQEHEPPALVAAWLVAVARHAALQGEAGPLCTWGCQGMALAETTRELSSPLVLHEYTHTYHDR